MKIIKYRLENRKIWKEVYDTELKVAFASICVYTGKSVHDCKNWLIERGLRKK